MSPFFRYHTRDANGIIKDGRIEALNEDDAVKNLQKQGLVVISVEMTEAGKPKIIKEEVLDVPEEEKQHDTTKKCPYCAEEIQYEAIKCRYCGGMLDTYKDWDKMLDKKQPEKWYFKPTFLVTAFLLVGPFALPSLWFHPRLNKNTKIIVTVIVIILSFFLGIILFNSIKSISRYYQQINQPDFLLPGH
jgi:hypothetical protein